MKNIGIIGSGLIGSSWALLFARAGLNVALYDEEPEHLDNAQRSIAEAIHQSRVLLREGEDVNTLLARITFVNTLEAAVLDADYIQEAIYERLDIKEQLFARLDELAPKETILASSTSTFGASAFTEKLKGRDRCVVAHPMTPPHLMPVVEVVASQWTSDAVLASTNALMLRVGQVPVRVKQEVPGFVLNRLQGAMLTEMFELISADVISASDADLIISQGLGLRWATLGPIEGVDLNAPTGVEGYLERYGHIFNDMAAEKGLPPPVNANLIQRLHQEMRAQLRVDQLDAKRGWRDETIATILLQMQGAKGHKPCSL